MVSGCPKLFGTMTFGEDWGAAKDEAMKSTRSIAKPAESCACGIEPVQRNKTMTRALAYGGMRDSVIALRASH